MKFKLKKHFNNFILMLVNVQLSLYPVISNATVNETGQVIKAVSDIATSVATGVEQGINQRNNLRQQQSLQVLVVQPLSPIETNPLFAGNNCLVLPSKTNKLSLDMKCDQSNFDPNQINFYKTLQSIAENNANQFDNFLTDGNLSDASVAAKLPPLPTTNQPAQSVGKSCYDRAINSFDQQLKARVELINELENTLDRQVDIFQKLAENDLNAIKRNNAILTGEDPTGEFLKDIRIEDRFNGPECASLISLDDFKSLASGGLNAIDSELEKKKNKAREFSGRTKEFGKEIEEVSKQIAQRLAKSSLADTSLGDISVQDRLGVKELPAFQGILNRLEIEKTNELSDLNREFDQLGAGNEETAIFQSIISEKSKSSNTEISDLERRIKNKCLNGLVDSNFGGTNSFLSRLQDPNISEKLNREADSSFKNFVESTLADNNLSIEQKIQLIRNEEKRGNNSRLTLVTGKSITIRGQQISASTRLRASDLIGVFENNCRDTFENDQNSKGQTQRDIVNNLINASTKYQTKKNEIVSRVLTEIKKDLIECPNSSTGKAANSCEGAVDTASPNFCFKTANLCAQNINKCFTDTRNEVDRIKNDQNLIATRYRQNFNANFKLPFVAQFQIAEQNLKVSARELDKTFNAGTLFETPTEFNLSILDNESILEGMESLKLQDPKAFAEKIKGNLEKVKEKIAKQNAEILAAANAEKEKILSNYQKEKQEWETLAQQCKSLVDGHFDNLNKQTDERNKKIQEDNKEIAGVCNQLNAFNRSKFPAKGEAGKLADEMLKLSATMGEATAIASLRDLEELRSESSNEFMQNDNFKVLSIRQFCEDVRVKDEFSDRCQELNKSCSTDNNKICEELDLKLDALCKINNKIKNGACQSQPAAAPAAAAAAAAPAPAQKVGTQPTETDINALTEQQRLALIKTQNPSCISAKEAGKACESITKELSKSARQLSIARALEDRGQIRISACRPTNQENRSAVKSILETLGKKGGEVIGSKALSN